MSNKIAFTAIVQANGYVIGAAEENIAGWSPTTYESKPTYKEACEFAEYLNREKLGLTQHEAMKIITSSMFPRDITTKTCLATYFEDGGRTEVNCTREVDSSLTCSICGQGYCKDHTEHAEFVNSDGDNVCEACFEANFPQ